MITFNSLTPVIYLSCPFSPLIFASFFCCTLRSPPSLAVLLFTPSITLSCQLSLHFSTHPTHLTLFLCPPRHSVWPSAPFWRDSSNRGQGAGRADQRASASWRCAIHSASHGPTGWTAGRPTQEPHTGGQGQRCPQPHQGNAVQDTGQFIVRSYYFRALLNDKKLTGM